MTATATKKVKKAVTKKDASAVPDAPAVDSSDALLSEEGEAGVEVKPPVEAAAPQAHRPITEAERIAESRQALANPAPHGTKFFESPEGYIEIAEVNKAHVWCRHANHGKGAWINPRR